MSAVQPVKPLGPAPFLKRYKKILFDMDGVITSEQNYWNAAALSVYEVLNSERYFGRKKLDMAEVYKNTAKIRKNLFVSDRLIVLLKERGVNTNWDLAYLALAAVCALGLDSDFSKSSCNGIYSYYQSIPLRAPDIYARAEEDLKHRFSGVDCSRFGGLWKIIQNSFNEWHYGAKYYKIAYGKPTGEPDKPGFMEYELPLLGLDTTRAVLSTLSENGITLGIGTGRPAIELKVPLERWGLMEYFDADSCVNHDDMINAQGSLQDTNTSLSKPHPWIFLKAALGKGYPDNAILHGDYDKEYLKSVLIVGDAGADILAAKAIPAPFAAVLTGVSGTSARDYFLEMKADYILDSIKGLVLWED